MEKRLLFEGKSKNTRLYESHDRKSIVIELVGKIEDAEYKDIFLRGLNICAELGTQTIILDLLRFGHSTASARYWLISNFAQSAVKILPVIHARVVRPNNVMQKLVLENVYKILVGRSHVWDIKFYDSLDEVDREMLGEASAC